MMQKHEEDLLLTALPLIKEFVTRPAILAALQAEGKAVAIDEIAKFENEIHFRIEERKLRELHERIDRQRQADCPHIAGRSELSECGDIAGRTSIVWHVFDPDNGAAATGICTTCQRKFFPEDEDYVFWRKQPSFNRLSSAGRREPILSVESDEIVPNDQFVNFYNTWEPLEEKDFLELDNEELNKRSTFEIRKVMEYVRAERKKSKEAENVTA
jgi:hypothetical protein